MVVLPDAIGMLALKARALAVRNDDRDAEDLWRCLEVAAADRVSPEDFARDASLQDLRNIRRDRWPGMSELRDVLSPANLRALAGVRSFERGAAYAATRRVKSLESTDDDVQAASDTT